MLTGTANQKLDGFYMHVAFLHVTYVFGGLHENLIKKGIILTYIAYLNNAFLTLNPIVSLLWVWDFAWRGMPLFNFCMIACFTLKPRHKSFIVVVRSARLSRAIRESGKSRLEKVPIV